MNIINKILENIAIKTLKDRVQKSIYGKFQQEFQTELQKGMVEKFKKVGQRIDALSFRERVLLFLTLLLGLYFLWNTMMFGFFLSEDGQLVKKTQDLAQKNSVLNKQIKVLADNISHDMRGEFLNKLQSLNNENKELQDKIIAQLSHLVTPKDMARIIKSIVDETKGLDLILLESKGSKLLFDNKDKKEVHALPIYDHGLQIEVIGDYFQIVKLLENLESQHSKMLWSELQYEVVKYPKAKVKIFIHTLGLEEGWIGI
jgi:MSHA biogenesis protein MshJ